MERTTMQNLAAKFGITLTPTVPATPGDQTPIGPGTIVSTSPGVWASIPTPVKLIGAGALAFLGYKTFLAKPKAKSALSGWRYRR